MGGRLWIDKVLGFHASLSQRFCRQIFVYRQNFVIEMQD